MTSPSTIQPKFLSKGNELGVVAVGFSGGQGKPGVDAAPTALIASGLLTQLSTDLHYTVHHDNLVHTYPHLIPSPESDPPIRGMKNPRAVSAVTHALSKQVYEHARRGRMVLTLGGDHSIAIGTVAGMARAVRERYGGDGDGDGEGDGEVAVIWVDAHADINTPESSDSGNVHGMPVAWLTGLAQRSGRVVGTGAGAGGSNKGEEKKEARGDDDDVFGWLGRDGEAEGEKKTEKKNNNSEKELKSKKEGGEEEQQLRGVLNLKKLVYIGLRDVDRGEKEILRREGIKAFSMHDIDKYGIGPILTHALTYIGPTTPIHLSFDVDALDPQWAPSTGTPVRGGLTLREGDYIAECVHETGNLVGMDLVEVNPRLDEREGGVEETVRAGVSLVRCALGDTLL